MSLPCPKCGTGNSDDSRFCRSCATPLPGGTPADAVTQTRLYPADDLWPGALFAGRYRIIEDLGRGGMGRVLKALDTRTNEKVAIKVVRTDLESDARAAERFSHELTAARKIAHRNVCRMYDLGEDGGRLYITMEYVSGEDLKSILRMMGAMSPAQAVGIARQICEGLEEAHRLGVVHRDLKPANVLVDRDGHARIMDFGIARSAASKGITGVGTIVGTPEYMSPEQASGADVDARADLYSLGVMLFEMTTGRLPFDCETTLGLALKHKTEAPPDPRSIQPAIPADLAKLTLKCLEKEPDDRHQTAADVRAGLEAMAATLPVSHVPVRRKPSTSREITVTFNVRRLVVPAILLVVLVVAAALVIPAVLRSRRAPAAAKTPRSVAVVAFDNQTGDPRYEYLRKVIPNLLITSLENAGLFQVATWERMRDVLAQAQGSGVELIEPDAGFDFCRREGIAYLVVGSFTRAGGTFVTEFKLLDSESRKLVASGVARGTGEASILDVHIEELSRKIASGAGGATVPAQGAGLAGAGVTTHSLQAYRAFLDGSEAMQKFDSRGARLAFETAVGLDPEFAVAHLQLGLSVLRDGERQRASEEFRRAMDLSGRASEKERLLIEARHAQFVERDRAKMIARLKELVAKYPREKDFHLQLGTALTGSDSDAAVAELQIALQLDPGFGVAINQLAFALLERGDVAGARAQLERYTTLFPDEFNPWDSLGQVEFMQGLLDDARKHYEKARSISSAVGEELPLAYIAAAREDFDGALGLLHAHEQAVPSEGLKADGAAVRALILHLLGRRAAALAEVERGLKMARSATDYVREAVLLFERGHLRCDSGDVAAGREDFRSVLALGDPMPSAAIVGRVSAVYGAIVAKDYAAADAALVELKRSGPKVVLIPSLGAVLNQFEVMRRVALGQDEQAIKLAENPLPYRVLTPSFNFGIPALVTHNLPIEMDHVAQALARRGTPDAALREYSALMTISPETKNRRLVNPIYHLRVAAIYEKKGDRARAAEQYRTFLRLWKDADPGLPGLAEARKRLAALGS